ncbi:MAG: adenosylcobinamide-phosphate synthase CbiB [Cyanobacteria bacterium P01_D01_bin.105]
MSFNPVAVEQLVIPQATAHQMMVLLVAAGLDYVVGDPWHLPHPVQAMGTVISAYSQWVLGHLRSKFWLRLAGIGLAAMLIIGSGMVSWAGLQILGRISPLLQQGSECVLLASCFAGRSLRRAAHEVLAPLHQGNLVSARQKLAMYVGRDTDRLSESDIYRAVLETVSENAIDGVLAPLFYAIVGATAGLAGPVAIAYKAASTLDSMVGYRREPYTHLGWFSARLEDALTWLPCRISVLGIAVLSRRPAHVLRLCRRDAIADPSPNAGWSECAYAAALGVQLGGENSYKGKLTIKPLLGDATRPITPHIIEEAFALTRRSFFIGLTIGSLSVMVTGLMATG